MAINPSFLDSSLATPQNTQKATCVKYEHLIYGGMYNYCSLLKKDSSPNKKTVWSSNVCY